MAGRTLTVEEILTVLREAPEHIATLTTNAVPAQLHAAPAPDTWSVNDVLAHLRSCADVWGNCIATILAENHPTIRAIDPRTWMTQTDYPLLDFHASFGSFKAQRLDLLSVLDALPSDAWTRSATVTGAGAPLQRTMHSYAQRLARHERSHVKQIERIVRLFVT